MSNSRLKLMGKTEAPVGPTGESANSRIFQHLLENTYKPGFIDKTDTESFKMSVDYELAEISKALFKTAERETNLVVDTDTSKKLVEELKVEVDGNKAAITEVKEVTVENGKAVAKLEVTVESNYEETNAKIIKTDTTVAELDRATAESIRELKAEIEGGSGSLTEKLEVIADKVAGIETEWSITSDVNGKVAGVQLINGTNKKSEFNVLADVFRVSHDADAGIAPFEIQGGKTLIKNAVVGDLSSDNWDGDKNGWAVNKQGYAVFNGVVIRGHMEATSGSMKNILIEEDCVIKGTARIGDAQVDTLQIAGNAVTIPLASEVSFTPPYPQISQGSGDQDVGCKVENVVFSAPARLLFSTNGLVEGTNHTNFSVRLLIHSQDGTLIGEKRFSTTTSGGNTESHNIITMMDIPTAGTYTVRVDVFNNWPSGAFNLKYLALSVVGTKR